MIDSSLVRRRLASRNRRLRLETLEDRTLLSVTASLLASPVAHDDQYTVEPNHALEVLQTTTAAECGFNDASGIHGDATPDSPYQFGATVNGRSTAETDWSTSWVVSAGGGSGGWDGGKAEADGSLEGDGVLHATSGLSGETWLWRNWGAAQSAPFVLEQWVRLSAGSYLISRPAQTNGQSQPNWIGPVWKADGGYFSAGDGNGGGSVTWENTGIAIRPGEWQKVSLLVDPVLRTYQFSVDDQSYKAPDPLGFRGTPTSIGVIDYLVHQEVWIDQIRVRAVDQSGPMGVLANDSDADGNSLTAILVATPQHGAVKLLANGSFLYTPDKDYTGPDSFTYKANDGSSDSNVATVSIQVSPYPTVAGLNVLFGAQKYDVLANKEILSDLPWKITGVELVFSEAVLANLGDLVDISGSPASFSSVSGSGTDRVTWTLSAPATIDRIMLQLASGGVKDLADNSLDGNGDGTGGDPFSKQVNVLWGDYNDDGQASMHDVVMIRNAAMNPNYDICADIDGNGVDDTADALLVRSLIGTRLDVDGSGGADALSDGILILRYLFDPSGAWNVNDVLGSEATRTGGGAIKSYLDGGKSTALDADGNGTADALSDGILILRYLFDPAGAWNVNDALGPGATRTTREAIRAYLDQYNPSLSAASPMIAAAIVSAEEPLPQSQAGLADSTSLSVDATLPVNSYVGAVSRADADQVRAAISQAVAIGDTGAGTLTDADRKSIPDEGSQGDNLRALDTTLAE